MNRARIPSQSAARIRSEPRPNWSPVSARRLPRVDVSSTSATTEAAGKRAQTKVAASVAKTATAAVGVFVAKGAIRNAAHTRIPQPAASSTTRRLARTYRVRIRRATGYARVTDLTCATTRVPENTLNAITVHSAVAAASAPVTSHVFSAVRDRAVRASAVTFVG